MTSTSDGPAATPEAPARDLVVSYCFPPYVDTAAIVAAKRVRQLGRRVDVIQNRMTPERRTDEGLRTIADHLVVRRNEIDSATYFSAWKAVVRWTELGLQQALAWDREGPGYERMYSRAHFAASHVLAARFKLLRPGIRWVAEFSDPLSHDVTGEVRHSPAVDDALLRVLAEGLRRAGFEPPDGLNVYEWAEVVAYALADEILFTNVHQRDLMVRSVSDPALQERIRQVGRVAPHPTLEPEFYRLADPRYPLEAGRRHIGYFGNFYATRGLSSVLAALEVLPQKLRDRVHLHVFTSQPGELRDHARSRGLQDVVSAGPFVDFLDFLALSRRMDVLLVNDAVTAGNLSANPFLPSKWSDYKGSGTPVWGIVERGSVLDGEYLAYRSLVGYTSSVVQSLAQIADG